MADEAKKKKSTRTRPRPVKGIAFTIWSVNGGPVPAEIVTEVEGAIEGITLSAFNDGHRLLTQTTRG